jgi:hypothetical protein
MAIAGARKAMAERVVESDLVSLNKFGKSAIFGNAAGLLVAHVKDALHDEKCSAEFKTLIPTDDNPSHVGDSTITETTKKRDPQRRAAFDLIARDAFSETSSLTKSLKESLKCLEAVGAVDTPDTWMTYVETSGSSKKAGVKKKGSGKTTGSLASTAAQNEEIAEAHGSESETEDPDHRESSKAAAKIAKKATKKRVQTGGKSEQSSVQAAGMVATTAGMVATTPYVEKTIFTSEDPFDPAAFEVRLNSHKASVANYNRDQKDEFRRVVHSKRIVNGNIIKAFSVLKGGHLDIEYPDDPTFYPDDDEQKPPYKSSTSVWQTQAL